MECESPGVFGSVPRPLRSAELVLLGLKSSLKVFCNGARTKPNSSAEAADFAPK